VGRKMDDLNVILYEAIKEGYKEFLKETTYVSVEEAGEILSLSRSTLYEAIRHKKLKSVKAGLNKGMVISLQAVQDYIDSLREQIDED
jgi:excisionase family DNA binding protein